VEVAGELAESEGGELNPGLGMRMLKVRYDGRWHNLENKL
jgi:hypothetical protein